MVAISLQIDVTESRKSSYDKAIVLLVATIMNARPDIICAKLTLLKMLCVLTVIFSSVAGLSACQQQPKSMFEQQAEADVSKPVVKLDASEVTANTATPDLSTSARNDASTIDIITHQTVAQPPNCDAISPDCQYFELNVLEFLPEQPWLTTIMWQTIARVLAPETPLASEEKTAQKTVSMLFNQIEYAEQRVAALPLYQRIDTQFVLNPQNSDAIPSPQKSSGMTNDATADSTFISTGYLKILSTQQRDAPYDKSRHQQAVNYVMLDIQKKLILNINDILLPNVTTTDLSQRFDGAKLIWLQAHNQDLSTKNSPRYAQSQQEPLAQQWYLDSEGLHLVYQSGELLATQTNVVDLVTSYSDLADLIHPKYIVVK